MILSCQLDAIIVLENTLLIEVKFCFACITYVSKIIL